MVPAIAVADALRAEGAEVSFVGGERAEAELVPKAGYELDTLNVEGLSRTNPLKAARALGKAGAAFGQARKILKRRQADAVLGGGGYVAGPVGLAAATSGTPLVLAEADSHLGISNRALASRARRVCLAFPLEGRTGDRYRVTGRPVPPKMTDRALARAQLGIAPDETCVLVFGGSLGARSINRAAPIAFKDAPYRVVHVAGTRDYADLSSPGPHYVLLDYLTPFGIALAAADVAVGRSGGSVFELAQYGLPSVLIPYPHASADHQSANAKWMADAGAARIVPDSELTPERLRETTDAVLAAREPMSHAALSLAKPNAAQDIAHEILAAVTGERVHPSE
ncbi:UDP-N-acetylglucosamine--N-acetylmuramyl-(pentapeptide) pyrophosphoryl-undecaprenol N-acetylglucosamine transferase [Solirubrobacter ginsenosidimutans]|uniref:UDP-N-acetylglucosamine--N-acetylmuramyl-(pentapeptide) pyrophosphoryl-undecaprenol N-acetylglucosamine transferase n=1 Tax=Solirubrobacter ginsenosidimutans TaxID=490573 RepID=A0A9X3MXW2_9ACTN|nr:UDP-N-acetylglucosamine--N-acetylmuramyl-(pentapeptide) pyrophosphoryl-undecaprenol N-acetylglucosamine transferase [Solirubrobacter ginsenosidimutans]MDA0164844.1 UDP-N-acetylglucosamine--N-acetylmuramyl-(pentapeptide) pyrophosphoryl-undecaprenol N-acetylglucosamine transferase [Solirubrobacter ginsenosidimutans]